MIDQPALSPRLRGYVESWPLDDNAIIHHGYAKFMRDYDVLVDAAAAAADGSGSYIESRYRFRFTHCVLAHVSTSVADESWRASWGDAFTDYATWERAGAPEGYVWGVEYMNAYPGASWVDDSPIAADWTRRLGKRMHELRIATNCHNIQLVFHGLRVHRVGRGDVTTRRVEEIPPEELVDIAG